MNPKACRQIGLLKQIVRWISYATPDFPTKLRWLNLIFWAELESESTYELPLFVRLSPKVYLVPSTELGRNVLLFGLYEREQAMAFFRVISEGDNVVDVGANFGQYTLLASIKVGPKGSVLAVEPAPHLFKMLSEHLTRNGIANVHPVEAAAAGATGVASLVVIRDENDGMHHLTNDNADPRAIRVAVRRLDDVAREELGEREIDVMKIDVEGWEESVLMGADCILAQERPPTIFFESIEEHAARFGQSTDRVREMLIGRGYQLLGLAARAGRWQSFDMLAPEDSRNLVAVHPSRQYHMRRLGL